MLIDMDMPNGNFQALAYGQSYCDEIWGTVADFTNIT